MANSASDAASLADAPAGAPYSLKSAPGGVIVLALASGVPFDTIRAQLRLLLGEVPARFKGARFRVDVGDRDLDLFELRRLIHLLKDHGVECIGLHTTSPALQRYAERELKLKIHLSTPELVRAADLDGPGEEVPTVLVAPAEPEAEATAEADGSRRLLTVNGTLRSGAVVRFGGDVQVFGDVNPGAEIVAGGNVMVYGALKGLACAGAHGDDDAVIFALDLRPTQLRIGKVIQMTTGLAAERPHRTWQPEIAWLAEGAIVVEPYRGRHPVLKEST